MNLKEMTVDELKQLKQEIEKELLERNGKKVAYEHDCMNAAKNHKMKYKHWAKLIASVDLEKTNAYGFVGDFLNVNATNLVPKGSIIVECCHETYTVYRITDEYKKEEIYSCNKKYTVECLREAEKALKGE